MPETQKERLSSLHTGPEQKKLSAGYSSFIRAMRFILPLIAIIMITLIFTWPEMEDTIEPLAREDILPDVPSAQNELLKPRYGKPGPRPAALHRHGRKGNAGTKTTPN